MTQKQHAITLTRPWAQSSPAKSHLREIASRLKRLVEIPTGYQDDTGFHLGTEPAPRNIQWPKD